jgi:WD40 repeat protein
LGERDQEDAAHHSPFAQALFEALDPDPAAIGRAHDVGRDGVVTATELYLHISEALYRRVGDKQTPGLWTVSDKGHDQGEFVFLRPGVRVELEQAPDLGDPANNPWPGLRWRFEPFQSTPHPASGMHYIHENALSLARMVESQPMVTVTGPSLSGKNSLVLAGLVPLLMDSTPSHLAKAGKRWHVLPPLWLDGAPMEAIGRHLAAQLPEGNKHRQPGTLAHDDPDTLLALSDALIEARAGQRLLMTLHTRGALFEPSDRDQLSQLGSLLNQMARQDILHIVLTLRSHYWADVPWLPANSRFHLEPLNRDALRQVVEEPAAARMMYLAPQKLSDTLAGAVEGQPAALPLLSETLHRMYLQYADDAKVGLRTDRTLTQEDYEAVGRVGGVVADLAEKFYEELPDEAHGEMMQWVLMRLVAMKDGQYVRRRAAQAEFDYPDPQATARAQMVIAGLAERGLVVQGADAEGHPYVELGHLALAETWAPLRGWLVDPSRQWGLQGELTSQVEQWMPDKQKADLWDDDPKLPQLEDTMWPAANGRRGLVGRLRWLKHVVLPDVDHPQDTAWLNRREVRFAQESVSRRAKVLQRIVAITLAIIVALSGLTYFAFRQQAVAEREAEIARAERDRAQRRLAGQLASLSDVAAERNLPQQRLLLAVEAAKTYSPTLSSAFGALYGALGNTGGTGFSGHAYAVSAVAFSPDGRWLVTASNDGTARLWDVENPAPEPTVLEGYLYGYDVNAITFSPNGRWLATAGNGGTARLWDMENPAAEPAILEGHKGEVLAVAFSPDGRWLATASDGGTARLWDMEYLTAEPAVLDHVWGVAALAFSHDSGWLATGSYDGTARLWNTRDPAAPPTVLEGHEGSVMAMAFSPNGRWLATGSGDNAARLWDVEAPAVPPTVLEGHLYGYAVNALTFSPNSRWLATVSSDYTARLWDVQNLTAAPAVFYHEGAVNAVAFSPDGQKLATVGDDTTAQLWDVQNPAAEPTVLNGHEGAVNAVAFSPDGRWLATVSNDGTARLWDVGNPAPEPAMLASDEEDLYAVTFSSDGRWLATGGIAARLWDMENPAAEPAVLEGHTYGVRAVTFSPDGRWLATTDLEGTARLWDVEDPAVESAVLEGHEGQVRDLAFSADSRWLATASEDTTARLWEIGHAAAAPAVLGHEGEVTAIAFSPDGRWLATASYDGTARLWNTRDPAAKPAVLEGHEGHVYRVAFSPNGRWLATTGQEGTALLWDMENPTAEPAVLNHVWDVTALAFSHDSNWLATGSYDGTARLWNTRDPAAPSAVLEGHASGVSAVAFSPNDRWLVTASLVDNAARLWDVEAPAVPPAVLEGHTDGVRAVAFSPDGRWLATVSLDGTARLWWTGSVNLLIEKACRTAGRNFSQQEWATYFAGEPYRQTCPDLPVHPSLAQGLRDDARFLAEKGDIAAAVAKFEEALALDPKLEIDAGSWATLCWFGGLWGHAADALVACEQAVRLDPDNSYTRDSRGLARALTGDLEGAIEDFEVYVEWLKKTDRYEAGANGREEWLAELRAGRNPFDEATLEALRSE